MSRPKLLLADDSVTIRKVVELTFSDEGIDVSTAADAQSAMQQFVNIQPDIVLVDIGLPGTSGYQICEMIKQDEATNHIPVLLLVGSFEPFDQDEAERVGADGFLTKPFHSIRDLVARVWDLLGKETPVAEPVPEIEDIENLYQSSFADTAEIEEYDTVDDLLGDAGMDDALIESSYPSADGQFADPVKQTSEPVKDFDWSAGSLITSSLAESGADGYEPNVAAEEPAVLAGGMPDDDLPVDKISDQTKEFDWSPESLISETATVPDANSGQNVAYADFGTPDLSNDQIADMTGERNADADRVVADVSADAPSPELIAMIAQKVIDHLSDRVVREIAREAVPRIAEKLIREALEEDSNV